MIFLQNLMPPGLKRLLRWLAPSRGSHVLSLIVAIKQPAHLVNAWDTHREHDVVPINATVLPVLVALGAEPITEGSVITIILRNPNPRERLQVEQMNAHNLVWQLVVITAALSEANAH
jgi:hypothetical protein